MNEPAHQTSARASSALIGGVRIMTPISPQLIDSLGASIATLHEHVEAAVRSRRIRRIRCRGCAATILYRPADGSSEWCDECERAAWDASYVDGTAKIVRTASNEEA